MGQGNYNTSTQYNNTRVSELDYVKDPSLLSKIDRAIESNHFINLSWFSYSNTTIDIHGSGIKVKLNPITDPIEWIAAWCIAQRRISKRHPSLSTSLSMYFDRMALNNTGSIASSHSASG